MSYMNPNTCSERPEDILHKITPKILKSRVKGSSEDKDIQSYLYTQPAPGLTNKRQEVSRSDKKRQEVSRSVKNMFLLIISNIFY